MNADEDKNANAFTTFKLNGIEITVTEGDFEGYRHELNFGDADMARQTLLAKYAKPSVG